MGRNRTGSRRWPTWMTGFATLVVLVAGIVAAATFDDRYPDQWDPRVADLADFAERERGLDFVQPVYVDFLDDEAFRQSVVSEDGDLTAEDRLGLEQGAAILRATGLASGDLDLLDSSNELIGGSTLAYYDPATERITVRGTELTIGVRATLVHEMTHVLQDQNFDLERLGTFPSDAENSTFLAVVEGDAGRIESRWSEQLSRRERQALDDERFADATDVEIPDEVPGALVALASAPYQLGDSFVATVFEKRGVAGIDTALRTPPKTEEQLLDPFVYLDGQAPQAVDLPSLDPGDELIEEGDFGSLTWYLLLAEQLDPRSALRAIDGWGGDAYRTFDRQGRACVRAAFRGDTPSDTDEMEAVLGEWTATVPANDASVSRQGDDVVLESCDPGADAEPSRGGGAEQALVYPLSRTGIITLALAGGVDEETARCFGDGFVFAYSLDELLAIDEVLADPVVLAEELERVAAGCR